ncbi:hypothetical protein SAMD00023353_0602570 [Rosellinia necatrix]|uniref:DUF6594 domain-containing protein n=1 Tax=Rosellinia necatrix TaxID=77044 RepID=A0A1S7ULN9_ROSNE|nr:hypothetical protein SAMD00023353_0602570 [Rosellinia necatrix]
MLSAVNYHREQAPDTEGPSRIRSFFDTENLEEIVERGFPSMAAMQTRRSNAGTFRTFEYLNWRLLNHYETKLSYLQDQTYRLDAAESKAKRGSQKSKLPFNKNLYSDCYLKDPDSPCTSRGVTEEENTSQDEFADSREKLFTHIEGLLKKHGEVVSWLKQITTFPRVHRLAHYGLFTTTLELHELKEGAIGHWSAIDEMAYINFHPIDSRIQNMWLRASPWVRSIFRCFCARAPPSNNGRDLCAYVILRTRGLKVLERTLTMAFSASLLIAPAGILYLGGLSKLHSFVVIVIFSAIFTAALFLIEQRIGYTVVGVVAYIAVLATLLDNAATC